MRGLLGTFQELKENNRSLMAFNLQNLYQITAASKISEEKKTPLIIQFSERYLYFLSQTYGILYITDKYRDDHTYFHLDYCNVRTFIKQRVD